MFPKVLWFYFYVLIFQIRKKKNPTHLKASWDFVCDLEERVHSAQKTTSSSSYQVHILRYGLLRFPWALGGTELPSGSWR